jgi:hypothetical protein
MMARAVRVMVTAMRVASNEEGNGKGGKGGKGNDNGNKGVGQVTATARKRAMATGKRVTGNK